MKKFILLVFVSIMLAGSIPIGAQVLTESNIFTATNGLALSDWDRIFYPSYSNKIEKNFIYIPFSTSNIYNFDSITTDDHYTGGTSFVLGPFRLFALGDIYIRKGKYDTSENESYSQQTSLNQDTNGDGISDSYQYKNDYNYSYNRNSIDYSDFFFSPGLSLNIGPITGGARYIFQMFSDHRINYEYSALETITDNTITTNNVATSLDEAINLKVHDNGLINGFVAGGNIDFGFVRVQADLFTTVKTYGKYDLTYRNDTHNLSGAGQINGTTVDYVTTSEHVTVENGWINFGALSNTSTIFAYSYPNTPWHFEYQPTDAINYATGGGTSLPTALPSSIHLPQIITDTNLTAQGELFGFIVPLQMGFKGSILTKKSFSYTHETVNYASADVESSHSTINETLTLNSSGNSRFYTGIGALKKFHASPFLFQLGAMYYLTTGVYNIKITDKLETITQVDGNGDGDYNDAASDTNTTRVQNGWYKERDYHTTYSTFYFPISFIFNITKNFEFFGGASFSYTIGKESSAYTDAGSYNDDKTTDNISGTVTTSVENYTTEPAVQHKTTSIDNAVTNYDFGLRYFFNPYLIFTTQLIGAEPTVSSGAGSLFGVTLIAEVEYRFGGKK